MTIPFDVNEKVENNRSGVYAIVNIVTRKFYIGSAVKLSKRKNNHLSNLRKGKHKNRHLQSSYNKHGEDCFIFKVLGYVEDKNSLLDIEDNWIKQYKPLGVLYNIREEASNNLGVKHSKEAKKKISEEAKGRIMSDEAKQKISEANTGKIHSDETKKKMSLVRQKPVLQFTKNNEFVKRYNSIIEAVKETGINDGNISQCCLGKLKTSGNYLWMYETDYLNGEKYDENNLINRCLKPVLQFTKNNEFVKRYNSITEASRETEIACSNISQCCSGKRKSAGGFIWKYEQQ